LQLDIDYLRKILPSNVEEEFFEFLTNLTPKDIKIYALDEGTIAFPRSFFRSISSDDRVSRIPFPPFRVPLIRVEGPLIIAQLLETTFLTLVNYARFVILNHLTFFQWAPLSVS
jgi:nicotinate phosphoribosyltransferase